MNITDSKAYILHIRPYRENSYLLEVFAEGKGRFSTVFRNKNKAHLFSPYLISTSGKRELKTIKMLEPHADFPAFELSGRRLFCAMYVNEVLYRCLPKELPDNPLFLLYESTLEDLSKNIEDVEYVLRRFEFGLFRQLGFSLAVTMDQEGLAIDKNAYYRFQGEDGFSKINDTKKNTTDIFSGSILLQIAEGRMEDNETLVAMKRLSRQAFRLFFGIESFSSRQFFES